MRSPNQMNGALANSNSICPPCTASEQQGSNLGQGRASRQPPATWLRSLHPGRGSNCKFPYSTSSLLCFAHPATYTELDHPDVSCWCNPSSTRNSLRMASMKVLCSDPSALAGGIPHHLSYSCGSSSPSLSGCNLWASADVSKARGARPLTMKTSHKHLCQWAEVV